jgi:hypothetical protein
MISPSGAVRKLRLVRLGDIGLFAVDIGLFAVARV